MLLLVGSILCADMTFRMKPMQSNYSRKILRFIMLLANSIRCIYPRQTVNFYSTAIQIKDYILLLRLSPG